MSARIRGWVLGSAAAVVLPWIVWQGVAGCAEVDTGYVPPGCPTARPFCGDGCVDSALGETCDDGNRIPGDGCDPSCHREGLPDAGDTTLPADDAGTSDEATLPDEATMPDETSTPEDTWVPDTTDTGSCPESPCRLWPQCGCPVGEKCTIDPATTDTTLVKSCSTAGSGTISSTCTVESDCSAGTACFALFTEAPTATLGMCFQFCAAQTDCSGAGSYCLPLITTASFPGACTHACNLLTGVGCPTGTKCNVYGLEGSDDLFTDCTSDVGSGAAGSYCAGEADCRSGTFCATSLGECIAYCTGPGTACSGGICNSFDPPTYIGTTEYGYCYY